MSIWNRPAMAAEAYDNQNPAYLNLKADIKKSAIELQMISVAGGVVGVAGLFFGMVIFGMNKGSFVIASVTAPLFYLAYNMYRIGENAAEMSENLNQYLLNPVTSKISEEPPRPDFDKIEKGLKKDTFYFGVFISFVLARVRTRMGV
jgi:hypothetical protein